ncbi:MAG TPA: hypothetical protein VF072_05590 [Thermoleophilaceae bacterium]
MALHLLHLHEPDVRAQMQSGWFEEREELIRTHSREACYGQQLSPLGWQVYDRAMPEALQHFDAEWLVRRMSTPQYWLSHYRRRRRYGGHATVRINPLNASRVLCEGEFNTAYVRGLARALLRRGESECIVYRAGPALEPRSECTSWEGLRFPLQQVIDGHRARYHPPPGNPSAWSIPTGPNCHHSIRAVEPPDR